MSNVVLSAAGLGTKAIRINEEVERLLRMTAWIRECLEAELADGLGTAGKHGIDTKTLAKWEKAVQCFKDLAAAKILLDKNAKALADSMSAEDELEAVRAYIRAMDPKQRSKFLSVESEHHALSLVPA